MSEVHRPITHARSLTGTGKAHPSAHSIRARSSMIVLLVCGMVSLLVIGLTRYGLPGNLDLPWARISQKTPQTHSGRVDNASRSPDGSKKSRSLKSLNGKHPNPPTAAHREDTKTPEDSTLTLDASFLGQWSAERLNREKPPVVSPPPSLASPSTSQGTSQGTSQRTSQGTSLNTRIRNAYRTRVFWLKSSFSKHTAGFGVVLEQGAVPAAGWRPEILWQAFEESPTSVPPYASGSLLGKENQSTQILDLPGVVFATNAANIKVVLKIGLRHPQLGRRETETADLRLRSLASNLLKPTMLPMTVHLGEDLTKKSSSYSSGEWVGVWNTILPGKAVKKVMIDSVLLKNQKGLDAVFKQLSLHQDFIVTDSAGSVL